MPLPLQKQQIYLIIGVTLALVALFMIKIFLDQQKASAEHLAAQKFKMMQANQTSILIAKDDIAKGTTVGSSDFTVNIVPNQFVQPNAVTSLDRISGMMTIAPISKGEQVTLSKFANVTTGGDLAQITPAGKRAITISVDNVSSLAGMIKAGDSVDVIALIPQNMPTPDGKSAMQLVTLPIFQNVLVLAIGNKTGVVSSLSSRFKSAEQQQESSPLITVALTSQEASLIAFVQEQGKIRLTLRSPTDTKVEPVQPASWDTLFQYVFPERFNKPEEMQDTRDYVEIIRGSTKEKVLLSQ